jgi:hypothetical protein
MTPVLQPLYFLITHPQANRVTANRSPAQRDLSQHWRAQTAWVKVRSSNVTADRFSMWCGVAEAPNADHIVIRSGSARGLNPISARAPVGRFRCHRWESSRVAATHSCRFHHSRSPKHILILNSRVGFSDARYFDSTSLIGYSVGKR